MSKKGLSNMRGIRSVPLALSALSLLCGAGAEAHDRSPTVHGGSPAARAPARFQRVATLPNYLNDTDIAGQSVSEIIASTRSGTGLVYTDALLGEIGFIDITDPSAPVGGGKLVVGGESTSVAVLGDNLALVAVNTSASFAEPSGHLAVVDIEARAILAELPLGGQPDSVAINSSGRFAAIAIENERDEEVVVDDVEGGLPQAPAGFLAIVDITSDDPSSAPGLERVQLRDVVIDVPVHVGADVVADQQLADQPRCDHQQGQRPDLRRPAHPVLRGDQHVARAQDGPGREVRPERDAEHEKAERHADRGCRTRAASRGLACHADDCRVREQPEHARWVPERSSREEAAVEHFRTSSSPHENTTRNGMKRDSVNSTMRPAPLAVSAPAAWRAHAKASCRNAARRPPRR